MRVSDRARGPGVLPDLCGEVGEGDQNRYRSSDLANRTDCIPVDGDFLLPSNGPALSCNKQR